MITVCKLDVTTLYTSPSPLQYVILKFTFRNTCILVSNCHATSRLFIAKIWSDKNHVIYVTVIILSVNTFTSTKLTSIK